MKRTLIVVLTALSMLSITTVHAQVSGYYDHYGRFVPIVQPQPIAQAAPGIGARVNEGFFNNPVPYYGINYQQPIAQAAPGIGARVNEGFFNGYQQPYAQPLYLNNPGYGYNHGVYNPGFIQTPPFVQPSPYFYPGYRNGSNVIIIQLPPIIINKQRWNNGY